MTEKKLTPIGEIIKELVKNHNDLVGLVDKDVNIHSSVINEAFLPPLAKLAKIDKAMQEAE